MPRQPKVSKVEAIALIETYIDRFATNDFPEFSDAIWQQMSKDLKGRWIPRTVYNHVRENKNNNLNEARRNQGIAAPSPKKMTLIEENEIYSDESTSEKTGGESDWQDSENETIEFETEKFDLLLSRQDWEEVKPDESSASSRKRLKKKVWAAIITRAFWKRYKFECAFLAKYSHVRLDQKADDEGYFLKFSAYCRDRDCGNKMIGVAHEPPDDNGLRLIICTRDTRGSYHREVKRPLNGAERKKVGKKLKEKYAVNYRDGLIEKEMEFGENVPPFIRENHVYRQAKMENNKEELGMGRKEKMDVIKSLQKLAKDPRYPNAIHRLDVLEFAVWYCTPNQIHIIREYCRVNQKSQIAIDGSGKFVRKFQLSENNETGHIFLYTMTINFEKTTVCVNQMLSTIHTQEFIEDWMKFWKRLGAPSPSECLSDYERAIPLSAALAFNNMSLKTYVDECFLWAFLSDKEKQQKPRPAPTLILIDVAHVMAFVSKWRCLKDCHPFVKSFFLRCVALLIDSRSILEFERIFSLICIVALQPYNDTSVNTSKGKITVGEAREKLEELIGSRRHAIENLETSRTLYEENQEKDLKNSFTESDSGTLTHQWVKKIISMAKPINSVTLSGKSVNAFDLTDFIHQLERIAKEFPLWTAAAIPAREKHASTAYQEGYFAHMRNNIFQNIRLPCEANLFLKRHLDSIQSGNKLMSAKLTHFVHRNETLGQPTDKPEALNILGMKPDSHTGDKQSASSPPSSSALYKIQRHLKMKSDLKKCQSQVPSVPSVPPEPHNAPGITCNSIPDVDNEFVLNIPPKRVFIADDSDLKSSEQWGGLKNYKVFIHDTISDDDDDKMSPRRPDYSAKWACESEPLAETSSIVTDINHNYSDKVNVSSNIVTDINHNYSDRVNVSLKNDNLNANLNDDDDLCDEKIGSLISEPENPRFGPGQPLFNSTALLDHSYCALLQDENNNTKQAEVSHGSPERMKTNLCSIGVHDPIVETEIAGIPTENKETVSTKFKAKIQDKPVIAKGCYFQPYPEIKIFNRRQVTQRKGFFLRNGLCLPPVVYNAVKVHVKRTCGFDSIVHILQFSALDSPAYLVFTQNSEEKTLTFLNDFMEQGATKKIYSQRLNILWNFHPIQRDVSATSLSGYFLDAEDFITKIWSDLLRLEPSAKRTRRCSNPHCPLQNQAIPFLVVNDRVIKKDGFQALEKAVQFCSSIDNILCRVNGCKGLAVETTQCNKHVFIELDIRQKLKVKGERKIQERGQECTLKSFPIALNLDRKFRLAGVIGFKLKHFTAYCLRNSGTWLKCDDMQVKIETCNNSTVLVPHGIIYVEE